MPLSPEDQAIYDSLDAEQKAMLDSASEATLQMFGMTLEEYQHKALTALAARNRHVMEHELTEHAWNRLLFNEFTQEQLEQIKGLLIGIVNHESPVAQASFWWGNICSLLQSRFNICQSCGKDHSADFDLTKLMQEGEAS